jgi:hypothetical protein
VPWHPDLAANHPFARNAKKLWGGAANWRTAMAYDATFAAITGLKSGKTRPQIQKALANPGFALTGATGAVQFLPSGDRLMKVALVKVQPGKASGMSYDFVPVKAPIKKIDRQPRPQTTVKTSSKPPTVAKQQPPAKAVAKGKPKKVVTKKSPPPKQKNNQKANQQDKS